MVAEIGYKILVISSQNPISDVKSTLKSCNIQSQCHHLEMSNLYMKTLSTLLFYTINTIHTNDISARIIYRI